MFQIKKSRKKRNENNKTTYPALIESTGINPEQYPDYED
ncbi:hypothetical protein MNBD_GAMMA10-1289 [hydrothermal vent metagenome]|uniref:Uncharacterized protein n=1 Tax=hydrothermal vent metagenome TaxID=652676 RepID=A0A3B0XNJ8_9ZZZZ